MNDKEKTMANLRMVLRELPKLAKKMPSIKQEFNMKVYGCYDDLKKEDLHLCNTAGCLLGNIARLFKMKDAYFNKQGNFSYCCFLKTEFPYLHNDFAKCRFLFDYNWAHFQPTFEQAMKRVKYFIARDGELGEWNHQEEDFV